MKIDTLRDILHESEALERKIRTLMRDLNLSDAPYGLASALTHLENFRDDIRNAMSELESREEVTGVIDFARNHWNVITYCERENAYGEMLPAEWFILNGPFASREEAEEHQSAVEENTKGTDADWAEAYAAKKIVHDDDLGKYGLKPLN